MSGRLTYANLRNREGEKCKTPPRQTERGELAALVKTAAFCEESGGSAWRAQSGAARVLSFLMHLS
jgi:hypothetical protein